MTNLITHCSNCMPFSVRNNITSFLSFLNLRMILFKWVQDCNHLLCGLVRCVSQTSVRGQVAGHERQDPMTARLLKAEKSKVTVCNHDSCTSIILTLLCSGGSGAAKGHRATQGVWGQQGVIGSRGLFTAIPDSICTPTEPSGEKAANHCILQED